MFHPALTTSASERMKTRRVSYFAGFAARERMREAKPVKARKSGVQPLFRHAEAAVNALTAAFPHCGRGSFPPWNATAQAPQMKARAAKTLPLHPVPALAVRMARKSRELEPRASAGRCCGVSACVSANPGSPLSAGLVQGARRRGVRAGIPEKKRSRRHSVCSDMELMSRFELPTSSLPMKCSTD